MWDRHHEGYKDFFPIQACEEHMDNDRSQANPLVIEIGVIIIEEEVQ